MSFLKKPTNNEDETRSDIWMDRPIFRLNDAGDVLSLRDCFANIAVFGGSGSGKTSGTVSHLLYAWLNCANLSQHEKRGAIIWFYKAGDVQDVLRMAKICGREDDVIHITPESRDVYNLLENEAIGEEITNVVDILVESSDLSSGNQSFKSGERFWEQSEKQLLTRTILLLKLAGIPLSPQAMYEVINSVPTSEQLALMDSASLKSEDDPLTAEEQTAHKFVSESACCQYLIKAAERVGNDHTGFKRLETFYLVQLASSDSRTRANVIHGCAGRLEMFQVSEMLSSKFCGETKASPELAFQGKIILLDVGVDKYGPIAKKIQLLYKYAAVKSALRRDLTKHPNPVLFCVDEAQNFVLKQDADFLCVSRSKRVCNLYASQSISNFIYAFGGQDGEARTHSLMSNMSHKFFHANTDFKTNQWASDVIGKDLTVMKSFSAKGTGTDGNSASGRYEYQYVVQPLEFQFLPQGGDVYDYTVGCIYTSWRPFSDTKTNYTRCLYNQRFLENSLPGQ
ncbi:MAG: TraM recognition domain-containing protein [Bacteroidota bacterium]